MRISSPQHNEMDPTTLCNAEGWPQSTLSTRFKSIDSNDNPCSTELASTEVEEHRELSQSLTSLSSASNYDSRCSYSYSTSGSDSFCGSYSIITDYVEQQYSSLLCHLEYSDSDDGHLPLIQSNDFAMYQVEDEDNDDDDDDDEDLIPEVALASPAQPGVASESRENRKHFCVQCHAWPEVGEHGDPPRKFYEDCYHTLTDPMECAFGGNLSFVLSSLSYVEESPAVVARRKAIELVLRNQFYSLIQQFSANPEKVGRKLYGVSIIDINDLEIATNPTVTEFNRAKVLTVTLVRRLRQWPDLFGDVCKVLSDIPAIQEANAKVRELLYEECSEDQYSKILAETAEHHHQSMSKDTYNIAIPSNNRELERNNITELSHASKSHDIIAEDSVSHTSKNDDIVAVSHTSKNDDIVAVSHTSDIIAEYSYHDIVTEDSVSHTSNTHDIVTEDSVSHTSKISGGSEEESHAHYLSNSSSKNKASSNNLLLHESCLENRSIRSLDALISDEDIDINARDQNGRTPLIVACLCLPSEKPNTTITSVQRKKIKSLLKKGADITIQDYDGNIALHIAALRQDQEVIKLLLSKAARIGEYFNIAVTNKNSRTALHYACYWGEPELVMPLLELERDLKSGLLNVRDRNGDTGLHIASRRGFKVIVKDLLREGVNKDIQNKDRMTAANVALDAKYNGIAKLLSKKKSRWRFPHRKSDGATGGKDCDPSSLHLHDGNEEEEEESSDVFYFSDDSDSETEF